jgi:hypothetical protein
MTGTNVGFGYWSHDIEGPSQDLELYTRWIQVGSMSGIMRSHDRGMSTGDCADTQPNSCSIVEPWNVENKYFEANRGALRARAALVPHMYTANRQAFDTGLCMMRPMYYEFPSKKYAYLADQNGKFPQYFLGDNLFVSPIVSPSDPLTSMTSQSVWVPPGNWYSKVSGCFMNGDSNNSNNINDSLWDLDEIPTFVKAGAVIATIPVVTGNTLGLAQRQYTTLEFNIYPDDNVQTGGTWVYEDQGYTLDYVTNNDYVNTTMSYTRDPNAGTLSVNVYSTTAANNGLFYPEFPTSRTITVVVYSAMPPFTVVANQETNIPFSRFGGPNSWTYDGVDMKLIITVASQNTVGNTFQLDVQFPTYSLQSFSGKSGAVKRAIKAKVNLDVAQLAPGQQDTIFFALDELASTGKALSFLAGNDVDQFRQTLAKIDTLFPEAIAEIKAIKSQYKNDDVTVKDAKATRIAYSLALLQSAMNCGVAMCTSC